MSPSAATITVFYKTTLLWRVFAAVACFLRVFGIVPPTGIAVWFGNRAIKYRTGRGRWRRITLDMQPGDFQ